MKFEATSDPPQREIEDLERKMRQGKIRWVDGRLTEIPDEEKRHEEPSVEIEVSYSEDLERREREVALSKRLDEIARRIGWEKGAQEKALEDTRTLESYRKSFDEKMRRGYGMTGAPTDEKRIREAMRLNDAIRENADRLEALSIAKGYYDYTREGLEASRSGEDAVTKTVETMEGEEAELTAKVMRGEASDQERRRLGYLKAGKAWITHLTK